jgi:hypothetical protein
MNFMMLFGLNKINLGYLTRPNDTMIQKRDTKDTMK